MAKLQYLYSAMEANAAQKGLANSRIDIRPPMSKLRQAKYTRKGIS